MSDSKYDIRFATKSVELKFLSESATQRLLGAATRGDRSIDQVATQLGLMDAETIDIVHSLLNPMELAPGYELLDLIGRGGMGVVYRARQVDLDRVVAIKVILLRSLSNPNTAQRFEREALAIARLQHPNIVQAWNFGRHNDRHFLAMEYVPGRTCDQLIVDGRSLPPQLAWNYIRQTASGLSHAHRHQVIHRDIKPSNLLVTSPPEGAALPPGVDMIKITDFGLALLDHVDEDDARLTTQNALVGSPAYMSPEQFGGEDVDFRSDVYSLGATAVNLLTAKTPFPSKSLGHLASLKMNGLQPDGELLAGLASEQTALLLQMLDPQPDRRPQSYAELLDRIDQLEIPLGSGVPVAGGNHSSNSVSRSKIQQEVTQLVSRDSAKGGRPLRWKIRVWALILSWIVAGVLGVVYVHSTQRAPVGPREFIRSVQTEPLFDGIGLTGWDVGGTMLGAWNVIPAPDGANSVACLVDQGAISRRVPAWSHQRIQLFIGLTDSKSQADIDFGLSATDPKARRWTLRVTGQSVIVGSKDGDFGELKIWHQQPAPRKILQRSHVVDIERQAKDWYIFFEEQFVTTVPIESELSNECIRMVVIGDESKDEAGVYFTDLQTSELKPLL